MSLHLDYFYGNQAEQFSFYRIPKALFTDPHYQGLSIESKVLYGLLLDRMGLSMQSGWFDRDGRVFLYFTLEDALARLGCGHNKAVRLFAELEKIGLIERKKQGQGKPAKIYVKNFIQPAAPGQPPADPDPETSPYGKSEPPAPVLPEAQTSQKGKSALPGGGSLSFPKVNANNTEKNDTERIETDPSIHPAKPARPAESESGADRNRVRMDRMDAYRELIREQIDYGLLARDYPDDVERIDGYVELMAEVCCTQRKQIRVNREDVPAALVQSRFLKLNSEHIRYVLESMNQNTTHISNIKAYTLSALYNAPATIGQYYASQVNHDMAQGF